MRGQTGDRNTRMSPRPLGDDPLPLTWLGAAAFQAFLFVLVVVLISPAAAVNELPAGLVCRAVVPAQEGGTARASHPGDGAVCWGGEEFKGGVCWAQTSPKFSWCCPRKWWWGERDSAAPSVTVRFYRRRWSQLWSAQHDARVSSELGKII